METMRMFNETVQFVKDWNKLSKKDKERVVAICSENLKEMVFNSIINHGEVEAKNKLLRELLNEQQSKALWYKRLWRWIRS